MTSKLTKDAELLHDAVLAVSRFRDRAVTGTTLVRRMVRDQGLRRTTVNGKRPNMDSIELSIISRRVDKVLLGQVHFAYIDVAHELYRNGWMVHSDAVPVTLPPMILDTTTDTRAHQLVCSLRKRLVVEQAEYQASLERLSETDEHASPTVQSLVRSARVIDLIDLIDEMGDFPPVEVVYELLGEGVVLRDWVLTLPEL